MSQLLAISPPSALLVPATPTQRATSRLQSPSSIQCITQTPAQIVHRSHSITPAQRIWNSQLLQQAAVKTPQQLILTQPPTPTSYPTSSSMNYSAQPRTQHPVQRSQTQISLVLNDPSSAPSQVSAAHGHARLRATQAQASASTDIVYQYVARAQQIMGRVCDSCFVQDRLHIVNTGEYCSGHVGWKCWKCYSCLTRQPSLCCPFPLIEYARQNKTNYCHQCGVLLDIHQCLPRGFCSSRTAKILKGYVATVKRDNPVLFKELTGVEVMVGNVPREAVEAARSSSLVQGWVEWLMLLSNDGFHGESFDKPSSAEF